MDSQAAIKSGFSLILASRLNWLKRLIADCKLIRLMLDTDVISETKLSSCEGLTVVRISREEARVLSLMGTKSHFMNCSLDSNRNKITRPNEKTSDFLSLFSKHSGLAKTGVPPLESDPAIPKSVKTISIWVKSVGPFWNFTKKFWGLISLWVWFLRSSVSRL